MLLFVDHFMIKHYSLQKIREVFVAKYMLTLLFVETQYWETFILLLIFFFFFFCYLFYILVVPILQLLVVIQQIILLVYRFCLFYFDSMYYFIILLKKCCLILKINRLNAKFLLWLGICWCLTNTACRINTLRSYMFANDIFVCVQWKQFLLCYKVCICFFEIVDLLGLVVEFLIFYYHNKLSLSNKKFFCWIFLNL